MPVEEPTPVVGSAATSTSPMRSVSGIGSLVSKRAEGTTGPTEELASSGHLSSVVRRVAKEAKASGDATQEA